MIRRLIFATAMVFITALAFTGPAVSETEQNFVFNSSQL